ncbi:15252_t:CDS:2 [Entrophospora sp. SA101]|nr:17182_t:CDS:2 [Entrophospora sp. SA101]CAJ0914057.1 15252_t:CDS:2 [Entrophospora sp. SA101]
MQKDILIFSTFIKLLLFPTYRSTDFEVHRNWLAITHSLPISKWYYEDTSEWTLDYPPFFAWFEWVLSKFATFYDDEMVKVENSNYSSQETIYFQRTTGNDLLCGITFAILLNFKHIFLYLSPAYFIYLLRNYCFKNTTDIKESKNFSIKNFLILGASVIIIFLISFGPFMYLNQIGQVLGRLFPFKRGLCHAYWAPNFWALYSALDRVLIVAGKQLGLELNEAAVDSVTRGLFSLIKLWKFPTYMNFLKSLISCGYSSFLFGWHVHEKAVLLVLIPFSLIVSENYHLLRTFMILSTSGLISLLPLLFKATGKCDI